MTLWVSTVMLTQGPVETWTRCVQGAYPAWRRMLTRPRPHVLTVPLAELLPRVRVVLAVADPEEPRVTLGLSTGRLRLSSGEGEGSSIEEVDVDYRGRALTLVLPGGRLMRYLETLGEGVDVVVEIGGEEEPVLVRGGGVGGYLLMPWERE